MKKEEQINHVGKTAIKNFGAGVTEPQRGYQGLEKQGEGVGGGNGRMGEM